MSGDRDNWQKILIQFVSYLSLLFLMWIVVYQIKQKSGWLWDMINGNKLCQWFWIGEKDMPNPEKGYDEAEVNQPLMGHPPSLSDDDELDDDDDSAFTRVHPDDIEDRERIRAVERANAELERQRVSDQQTDVKEDASPALLMMCVGGIIGAYFLYGLLQERIMTGTYSNGDGEEHHFRYVELLVTMNRFVALIVALVALYITMPSESPPPYYKYCFASTANILSSWCQYESLEYITFPMQVVAKSSKIMFTMFMGLFVRGKGYNMFEYATAFFITIGLIIYRLGGGGVEQSESDKEISNENSMLFMMGIGLIAGYVFTDGFVSNWQQSIFREHKVTSFQMMWGINLCSFFIGLVMLFLHDDFFAGITFLFTYPLCLFHVVLISLCGAVGQIFIFTTISNFGAVVYAVIMTCRQLLSVLASIFLYHHSTSFVGWIGLSLVFIGLAFKVGGKALVKKAKSEPATPKHVEDWEEPIKKPAKY